LKKYQKKKKKKEKELKKYELLMKVDFLKHYIIKIIKKNPKIQL
jgi:hypothetical protein